MIASWPLNFESKDRIGNRRRQFDSKGASGDWRKPERSKGNPSLPRGSSVSSRLLFASVTDIGSSTRSEVKRSAKGLSEGLWGSTKVWDLSIFSKQEGTYNLFAMVQR